LIDSRHNVTQSKHTNIHIFNTIYNKIEYILTMKLNASLTRNFASL